MSNVVPVVLTARERLVLESYKPVLEGLAEYLGSGFEIVLHTLEDFDHSVIKIANGQHTGRKVGDPISSLALDVLEKAQSSWTLSHISYFTKNMQGRPLKSATMIIRGVEGRPIGLMCINMYLDTPFSEVLAAFDPKVKLDEDFNPSMRRVQGGVVSPTALGQDPEAVIREETERAKRMVEESSHILPSLKNREVVAILEERGIFSLKDSVTTVADCLGISKNTVYMHLRKIRE